MRTELTAERLRELLHYDPETGVFTRAVSVMTGRGKGRPIVHAGSVAGYKQKNGYTGICIDSTHLYAHRLAWLYMHGAWPTGLIDHINGNKADNRIANLRVVSRSVNAQNLKNGRPSSSSGLLGVSWSSRKQKWVAQIKLNYRGKFLGHFDSAELAHQAYLTAKRKLHEGCTI